MAELFMECEEEELEPWQKKVETPEEEDDDDVVGPPGDTSVPAGTAGPSEGLEFSRSPSSSLTNCLLPCPPGNLGPKESG